MTTLDKLKIYKEIVDKMQDLWLVPGCHIFVPDEGFGHTVVNPNLKIAVFDCVHVDSVITYYPALGWFVDDKSFKRIEDAAAFIDNELAREENHV